MPDPEDFLTEWQRRVEQQTTQTTELSRRMQHVRASASAHGGEVEVTVDHSGGLAGLELSERALRLSPGELSRAILETSRRAQAQLASRMNELVTDIYGEGSDTAGFIGSAYAETFPPPPEDEEESTRRDRL
ncbi:YbaB/EbfC family nucleoid-associated protein [Paractinoplanes maris]|uniref:YbaB/EbfC family nucleoid-associated protein n=1 Tax=Paractinoplanes maris TaxID=1734446 RepID=UPI002020FD68|nr:YbaB/EbfC family nucleoid-associated protein [Actinoplanes maris]